MQRVAGAYGDLFAVEVGEKVLEAEHPKHGLCVRCTYPVRFHRHVPDRFVQLPYQQGVELMQLIRDEVERNGERVVRTRTKGKRDFADWRFVGEREALIEVFLQP